MDSASMLIKPNLQTKSSIFSATLESNYPWISPSPCLGYLDLPFRRLNRPLQAEEERATPRGSEVNTPTFCLLFAREE